ncbi:probable E3 ubiquitin-protein ligase ARI3 [Eutrema salsugineum]|nr:probable E3 ubiquitin-protein ligase ARI3 [Eutrema salsugineum]
MKGPIHGYNITVLEAELTALKRGLKEAADLGINHITIYCDYHPIHELVTGRSMPKDNKTAVLINDVQRIRERFASSFLILVSGDSMKYAYKLAKEIIVSEISISVDPPRKAKPAPKSTCPICFDDDTNADQMFTVDKCRHRFCSQCVKRHIEVRLLDGSVMRCPHYRCKSKLALNSCASMLTPKLNALWQERIKEDLIPYADRVYCPNPKCSALMSKTELSKSSKEAGYRRCCSKCGEHLCTNCKVPWHENLACKDYKMLHPSPTENDGKLKALANQKMWRQCGNCQHMIELSKGCVIVICRCGHDFCYRCGAKAKSCRHGLGHGHPPSPLQPPPPPSQLGV